MEINQTKITELKNYDKNAKQHPPEQIQKITESIKTFGFNIPILIDSNNEIIAGHGRLLASIQLGLDSVPTIQISHLTPQQIKAFRIADNKTAISDFDYDILKQELINLKENNFDLTNTGFSEKELNLMNLVPISKKSTNEIKEFDENIILNNKCPSCQYEW